MRKHFTLMGSSLSTYMLTVCAREVMQAHMARNKKRFRSMTGSYGQGSE
jgi:hypothetical protein